jgi:hypothetical protein
MNVKKPADRRTAMVQVPATKKEREAWRKLAAQEDRSLASWLRTLANGAVPLER